MVKAKLSQAEFDKIVVVERMEAKPTVCTYGVNDIAFQISNGARGVLAVQSLEAHASALL